MSFSCASRCEDFSPALLQTLVIGSCGDPSDMLSEALTWSCTGPCEKLLKGSWWNIPRVRTWCGTGTGPCEKILWWSCRNPPREFLALRSWSSSALVIVWNFVWNAHNRKFWYEDLVRFVDKLHRRSCFCSCDCVEPHLLLFHSYCYPGWYIDFLLLTRSCASRPHASATSWSPTSPPFARIQSASAVLHAACSRGHGSSAARLAKQAKICVQAVGRPHSCVNGWGFTQRQHYFLGFEPFRSPFQGNSRSFPQAFPRQLSQLHAPDNASNPSAGLSKATLAATGPSHLFLSTFKTAVCPPSKLSNPSAGLPKATLAASRKPFQGNSRSYTPQTMLQTLPQTPQTMLQTLLQAFPRQLSQLHAPAICF